MAIALALLIPAIALYMLLLATVAAIQAAAGRAHPAYLLFAAIFAASAFGLLFLFRWAWALALGALALVAALFLWLFASQHDPSLLLRAALNLALFFYLVRGRVREKLR